MSVLQSTLLTSIRERLDEATASQWSDVFLRRLINEGARDIARKTETLEDSQTIAATISPITSQYSLSSNCIRAHMVQFEVTSSGIREQLEYVDIRNMEAFGWANRNQTATQPTHYTIWGSGTTLKLNVFPAPAIAGSFYVSYYRLPADLATDGTAAASAVEIPEGWADICIDYVEFRALRQDRDPRWQEAKALYDESLQLMLQNTRRWVDQAGLIVPANAGGGGGFLPNWLVGKGW